MSPASQMAMSPLAKAARVSDTWHGMRSVFRSEREPLQRFISSLNFDWLRERANKILGSPGCRVRTDIFSHGREHVVFEICSPNSSPMVARISKPPFDNAKSRLGPAEMLSEVQTIEYVSQHTTIPVPRVVDYNVDPNNPLGAPYVLIEEIQGRHVEYLPRIPHPYNRHVYSQIANIVLQLSALQFPRIGMLECTKDNSELHVTDAVFEDYHHIDAFGSAKEYYIARARRFLSQKESETPIDVNWAALAWLYLRAIPMFCPQDLDTGPFPLRHPDLNNLNILYDDNYNIMGVIDWTSAQAAPWQSFVVPPNQFESIEFLEQRNLYIEVFEEVERSQNPDMPLSKMMKHSNCEITELIDGYYGWQKFPGGYALRLARLVFGDAIN